MSYFLSPALAKLRDQINAAYDGRDTSSDGWIGDTSHAARPSDHNPDWADGGIVRAIDIDEDLVIGMTAVGEAQPLADALLLDRRTRYVIYEGRIAYGKHVTGVTHGWRPYTGVNAHRHHIHVSVRSVSGLDRDARSWSLGGTATTAPPEPDMDKSQDRKLDETHKAATALVRDGDRWLEPHDADRVQIALLRRVESDNAARNRSEKDRDADQRKQIAGLTAAITELAKAQNKPVEATLDAIRDAIAGITITVSTEEN